MKGFLFTVSLVVLAMVIISLSFFVMEAGQRERSDVVKLALFDSIKNNQLWIENGFRDIVREAGITMSVDGYNVSFVERLPNPNGANFTANVDEWKNFSVDRSQFPLNLSDQDIKDYLPLTLRYTPVTYKHPNGLSGDTIMVENASNVANYSLDLDIDIDEEVTLTWTSLDTDPAELSFRIRVHNNSDTFTEVQHLDAQETSTLSISMSSGTITLDVGDPADYRRLVLSNPNDLNATLTTNITLSTIRNPMITFPNEVISLYSEILNLTTASRVRIA